MTLSCTMLMIVRDHLKSTLQRYIPLSDSKTGLMVNRPVDSLDSLNLALNSMVSLTKWCAFDDDDDVDVPFERPIWFDWMFLESIE